MLETLRALQAEQTHRSPGWRAAVHARLLDLLIAVARINLDTEREPRPPLGDRVGRAVLDAVSHIEQHFEQSVALDDLARRVHLSPGYLSRCFSERMGMGVVEFMHTLRAEEACRLLRWSGLPVGRIAERVGYRDVAYFSRCFSRRIGESPTRYRERWTTLGTD
jgi:transcriptional regulator GlxA family with amidase domain